MNADDVTSSCGLFLTCRGEKHIQYYTTLYMDSIYVQHSLNFKKSPLLEGVAISQGANFTSPHSGPVLKVGFPVSNKLLASPFPKPAPF
jgi:hypothetical protein